MTRIFSFLGHLVLSDVTMLLLPPPSTLEWWYVGVADHERHAPTTGCPLRLLGDGCPLRPIGEWEREGGKEGGREGESEQERESLETWLMWKRRATDHTQTWTTHMDHTHGPHTNTYQCTKTQGGGGIGLFGFKWYYIYSGKTFRRREERGREEREVAGWGTRCSALEILGCRCPLSIV